MKKKLYTSIIAVLLPSILYICFFYLNDPHGYFCNSKHNGKQLIDNMLDWKNGSYNALLIGDSRMTNFDEAHVAMLDKHTGYKFKNMAYGGAMNTEMNYLIRWCLKQKPVKSIIIVTGWYNFNELLQQNRVKSTEKILENPLSYAFSIDNLNDMFINLANKYGSKLVEEKTSTYTKEEILNIEKEGMYIYLSAYKTDASVLDDLLSILKYCLRNQIEIKMVIPPWLDRFYQELINYGQYDIDSYKAILSNYVDIYDMEFQDCLLSKRFDEFSDYSHFHGKMYYEDFSNALIYGNLQYARLWRQGKIQ